MKLIGANPAVQISGLDELPVKSNYYIGNDPAKWHINVSSFARLEYHDVYPGVNLLYYGNGRQLEHDFVVQPGADAGAIKLSFQGAKRVSLNPAGELVMKTSQGEVQLKKPHAYQTIDGREKAVAADYVLLGESEVIFKIGNYDRGESLVIDPVLSYSTYLGGKGFDYGRAIAVDGSGSVYVTGETNSVDFPTTKAAHPINAGSYDVFVAKLNPAGTSLMYSTYLGGGGLDRGLAIAADSLGNAYVTGSTASTDFPTVNPIQAASGGGLVDVFVVKLNPDGAIMYSTYLGGGDNDQGFAIAVDSAGNGYVTGSTSSLNFPVVNAIYPAKQPGVFQDAFIAKLNASGSALIYSTYLGGSKADEGHAIAVDSSGNAYVAGQTTSIDFPTINAVQPASAGNQDGFVAKLNSTGSALIYSTYLGGSGDDYMQGIVVDIAGNAYLTGFTLSRDFPTTANAFQSRFTGGVCSFVTKINPAGSALSYSTFLASGESVAAAGIAIDSAGSAYVAGTTTSALDGFPTLNALQSTYGGGADDGFVTKLNPTGSALAYSTYLGGADLDLASGIAVDSHGSAYIAGFTQSSNFPTASPLQATLAGNVDTFISKIQYEADLAIVASVDKANVHAGDTVTLTLTASNSGPNDAKDVKIIGQLPSVFDYKNISADNPLCTVDTSAGLVTCPLAGLAAGGTATVKISEKAATAGTGNSVATIVSSAFEPNPANNSATASQTVSDYSISANPAAATVRAGQSATFTITLTPSFGFNGVLGLACSGIPQFATCTLTPPSVTLNGAAVTSTMVITTAGPNAAMRPPGSIPDSPSNAMLWILSSSGTAGLVLLGGAQRRRTGKRRLRLLALLLILLAATALSGCGGSAALPPPPPPPPPSVTPAGTSTVTVSATGAGSPSHSVNIALTVNP